MSKEQSDDRGTFAISSGVMSVFSAAFGVDIGGDPAALPPPRQDNPPKLIGRKRNRRTREPDDPRLSANHRSNRSGNGRT